MLKPSQTQIERPSLKKQIPDNHFKAFVDAVLASRLSNNAATAICLLVCDERMKGVWSFLSGLNDKTAKKYEIYETDSWLVLRAAVNTFLQFQELHTKQFDYEDDLEELATLAAKARDIILRQKQQVCDGQYGTHGYLSKLAFEACIANPDPHKSVAELNGKHSGNEMDTVNFLERLSENTMFYQSFRKQARVTVNDFSAITREKLGKQGVLRAYIGGLRNGGLGVDKGKIVTLIIPAVVSVMLTLLEIPADDVNDDTARKTAKKVAKAEDNFFEIYDDFIDRLPPISDDEDHDGKNFPANWMV